MVAPPRGATTTAGGRTRTIMLVHWLLLLVSVAAGQEVYESTEDTTFNTTTLYPTNKTIDINRNYKNYTETQQQSKISDINESNAKENRNKENKDKDEITRTNNEKVTKWAIDTNYAQPKDEQSQAISAQTEDKETQAIRAQSKDIKKESVFAQPTDEKNSDSQPKDKESEDSNSMDSKEQSSVERPENNSKLNYFKPSPHLGSFFDDENLNLLKFSSPDSSIYTGKKPVSDILGSKDFYMLNYKSPKDTYRDQLEAPYRFETSHFLTANNWGQTLDSKPTVESSVKIPAGGLYKHPNPFKEKPNSDDDDFGLSFSEDGRGKENAVKKRPNPFKSFVQLMTAFLPVGLIISALTPNIITLQTTDNDPFRGHGRGGMSRRADGVADGLSTIPAISERCRRRLLCEIHAEQNYLRSQDMSGLVRKHCYKLHCEDLSSLGRVLTWLLAHQSHHQPSHRLPQEPQRNTDVVNYRHRSHDFI